MITVAASITGEVMRILKASDGKKAVSSYRICWG